MLIFPKYILGLNEQVKLIQKLKISDARISRFWNGPTYS